jgi:hypothetical protein
MALIHCSSENGPECETNEDCPEGFWCNRTTGTCDCMKDCTGKCCGDDNCGGTCPDQCGAGYTCNTDTCTCISDRECSTDQECINLYGANYTCNQTSFECECNPDCTGKCCGDNGCGGTCQDNCTAPSTCNATSCECEWPPCNDDDDCAATQCCINTVCTDMDCGTRECGDDPVCGKSCGTCTAPETCQNGQCVGENGPGSPCTYGDVNPTAGACDAGLECLGVMPDGQSGTCPGGSAGECTNLIDEWNPDCVNGNCGASFCSEECGANRTCPAGFTDQDVGTPTVCYCVPLPQGAGDPGDPCPWDSVNASYDDCKPGLTCLGNDDMGNCPGGNASECTIADSHNPDCVNGVCGFSFCSPECNAGGTCNAGFNPITVSGTCYCIPDEDGTSQAGEPCPFGDMNNSYDFCASGLSCLGNDDAGTCPGGSPTECSGIPDVWNPDCVSGVCGFSHCTAPCDANGNCPNGFSPETISGSCYCIPEMTGTSQAGEPCPYGDVNTTADYCAADLACLGVAADGTAGTCPGGAATECSQNDPPIPANQNPDCVNNNCGASFCAAECDASGNCPAGFAPEDVGDPAVCYCVPS